MRATGVDGQPTTAHRGRCALRPSCSVQQQTHVVGHPTEGASRTPPPTGCASCRFQRSREVQFITAVTCHAATSVSLPPVGCTVLGAPWPRDCRVSLAAVVWLDRLHPRHPRRTRLASTAQHIQSRGHRPRTIFYGRTDVIHHPTPGGHGSPPLRWVGRLMGNVVATHQRRHQPLSHGPSGRDSSPFRGAEKAGCGAPTLFVHPRRPQPLSRGAPLTPRLFFLRLCPLLWGSWPWSSCTRARRAWCWHRARRPRRRRRARPRQRGGLSWRRPRPGPGP